VYSLVLGIDYCVHLYHLYLEFYLDSCSRTQFGSIYIYLLFSINQMKMCLGLASLNGRYG
jgi:hypothetical protein